MMRYWGNWLGALSIMGAMACDSDADQDETPTATSLTTSPGSDSDSQTSGGTEGGSTTGETSGADSGPTSLSGGGTSSGGEPIEPPVVFDFGAFPDVDTSFCGAPDPTVCDGDDDDPWHAMGLNCPGGPQVDVLPFTGRPDQLHVHAGEFGSAGAFPPREGEKMVILSSGAASQWVSSVGGTISTEYDDGFGPGQTDLPNPMTRTPVSATETCADNPALVGTGDCSNTVEVQYAQGGSAYDIAFMSFSAEVPANTFGFTYDFAFLSVEYPAWYQSIYNDMYVAWLESEAWTGNISFDEFGSPISLNAGFLDFKDVPGGTFNDPECAAGCTAPELHGTAAQGHAATRWLTTNAPVVPGETIGVYFTIFDLADSQLDSGVLLDNWLWTCDGGPPVTIPG